MVIPLEVCIDSAFAAQAAQAAYEGGANRIELCSHMNLDGLTPSIVEIKAARKAFLKPGLMVMIRPRADNFIYNLYELKQMQQQVQDAKDVGADGVVFGILKHSSINLEATREIVTLAKSLGLTTTFHRAFDAVKSREEALEQLIDLGVDKVLTSGTAWNSNQGALAGLSVIQSLLEQARERIEIVIGGGINKANIRAIKQGLRDYSHFSIHVYSGAQENGVTTASFIHTLIEIMNPKM